MLAKSDELPKLLGFEPRIWAVPRAFGSSIRFSVPPRGTRFRTPKPAANASAGLQELAERWLRSVGVDLFDLLAARATGASGGAGAVELLPQYLLARGRVVEGGGFWGRQWKGWKEGG